MLFATGLGLLLLVKGQILPENIVTEIREHQGMCFMLSIMHGVYTRVGGRVHRIRTPLFQANYTFFRVLDPRFCLYRF